MGKPAAVHSLCPAAKHAPSDQSRRSVKKWHHRTDDPVALGQQRLQQQPPWRSTFVAPDTQLLLQHSCAARKRAQPGNKAFLQAAAPARLTASSCWFPARPRCWISRLA
eukprot:GHRQ01000624.1.p3 GENE.GHRQ01000624.1~~GHRQ01000624.1.p3  ORF type:complete len:109 (-),score=24.62 GHRQ01000624.1:241-567(-)